MNTICEKSNSSQEDGLLDHFPREQRSFVANQFYNSIRRHHASSVGEILASVHRDAEDRIAQGLHVDSQTRLLGLLESPEARAFAEYVLDRESLPAEQKAELKVEQRKHYQREYLQSHKPTIKQLRYLRKLGCPSVPDNMQEASDLISSYRTRGFVWP